MVLPGHPAPADTALLGAGHPAGIGGIGVWQAVHSRRLCGCWPRQMGLAGDPPASLLGIASPLCMYGTLPLASSFSEQGVKDDSLAAFMMSSVLLNPQLLLYSAALGRTALIVRLLSCFLCGCTAGWLVRACFRNKPFFDFRSFHARANRDTHPHPLVRYLLSVLRNLRLPRRGSPWVSC